MSDLTDSQKQVFNLIKDVNLIISFPYTDLELYNWVKTIFRLFPNISPDIVARITDRYLMGEAVFDRDIGIVNFTKLIPSYSGKFN